MPDPDVEFVDLGGPDYMPVAIQHSTGHYMRVAERVDGTWKFNLKQASDLLSFIQSWSANLLDQGFVSGRVVRAGPA